MGILSDRLPEAARGAVAACRGHFLSALLFSALVNLLYLAPTVYMMQVYDRVVPTGGEITLAVITVTLAAAIATLALLEAVRARLLVRASARLDRQLAATILARLIARGRSGRGDPSGAQAMREFDSLRQVMTAPTLIGFFDAPWTPIYVAAAVLIHPLLGLFVILAAICLVTVTVFSEHATRRLTRAAHSASARSAVVQEEIAQQAEIIRALGMERAMIARQLAEREGGQVASARVQLANARYAAIAKFMRMLLQSLALGVAAMLAIERQISVGSIIAASVLLSRALQPIELLIGGWSNLQNANEALKSLKGLLDGPAAATAATALPAPEGRVTARKLVMRSPEGTSLLLKGVSFDLAPGSMMGIVGASGAGKTTLIRVLAGCIAPEAGEVLVDGADASMWEPERLARFRGYVPQEPVFLSGTVAQNIARFTAAGEAGAADLDQRVIAAAQAAGCHQLILSLPGGYDCPIGRAGVQLSAGQRQRVALARALFDDPAILLLDEPNAALDADGEAALVRALDGARRRGATILIAAHRTSVLTSADRLLVLAGGAVECDGPTAEVMATLSQRAGEARSNVVGFKGGKA